MTQYIVTGMSCAACSARVEKAVSALDGVESCSVSLLTNSMSVEGDVSSEAVTAAVEAAGYGAFLKDSAQADKNTVGEDEFLKDRETPLLKKRLLCSVGFLAVLLYFSMGHTMFGLPLPDYFDRVPAANALVQLLLSAIIMVINQKFFTNGFRGLANRAPNMDTLVALGSGASFVYSTYALFMMLGAQADGDTAAAAMYIHELYFESAAMILTLITVGKMLEARSKGKTTDAIKGLVRLAPKTAVIVTDEGEKTVPIEQVKPGDIFVVRPGESIPADGIVAEGSGAVDESALTGESIPVDKEPGDTVCAATINRSGFLRCKASKVGEDTALSRIIKLVSDAAATKAPIAKAADKVSGIFVPAVITAAVVCTAVWLITGSDLGFALARGISVLVISCPCALGLATPVAIMVGSGKGARNGILFKTAAALEGTGRISIAVLDKTGTITKGEPVVTDIIPLGGISENELVSAAYSLENKSEHPLAKAVVEMARERGAELSEAEDFKALPGNGLSGAINGKTVVGGSYRFISRTVSVGDDIKKLSDSLSEQGKTPLFFARDDSLLGIIAVADVIKQDSLTAIRELKAMGIRVVMLTGDNEKTARSIGKQAEVSEVIAGVLPEEKEKVIRSLRENGKTAMVGDGINDAPALTAADIGIAIGAGTDIAIDAADIVLMNSSLKDVCAAVRLGRATLRNIHENLFWAFFYNVIGIPLAAGVWIPIFGWKLNPMFAAAAMSLSSFCVVSNALRLNFADITGGGKRKSKKAEASALNNKKSNEKETSEMEKTIRIEGMMCPHCEATVKKALEQLPDVSEAFVSHEKGTAVVKLGKDVPFDVLKNTVEAQGYTVVG